ncbi:ribonuclease H-like domain-containing protein [Phascolomyces articulosus]|uniref:DNA polymerase delta catalytic subunit n=1 Tax=Phascolomyces articulosus TaxID=60185 RepID=A0AAD5PHL3_9FUNG|nr:ribonuclease H-like domain-containing protein [Phascolomyces articulosus]
MIKTGKAEKMIQTIFTLDTCSPIPGVDVIECKDETQLLEKWHAFLLHYDPDIMIGYYFQDFDLRYMIQRAERLKIPRFPYLGRNQDEKVKITKSCHFGKKKKYDTIARIPSRELVDMWVHIAYNYRDSLRETKLKFTSMYFLGEKKIDMDYEKIPSFQIESADTRKMLAQYCLMILDIPYND